MAIYLYTGRPRHGKTYELARLVIKMLKKRERVFSNIKFYLDGFKKIDPDCIGDLSKMEDRDNPEKLLFYWTNMHEWEHFEKGNIIVDETQRYFNSRLWEQLSEDTLIKLQQHGKDFLNIYGTVQHYKRIDVAMRELVEIWCDVETIFGSPDNYKPLLPKIFRYTYVEGIEYFEPYVNQKILMESKLDIPYSRKRRMFRKKYANAYNTLEKVGASSAMPLVHKSRNCPDCGKQVIKHY